MRVPISAEFVIGKKGIISEKYQYAEVTLTTETFEKFCRAAGFNLEAEKERQRQLFFKKQEAMINV